MLEFAQGKGDPTLVFVDPTFGNLTQGDGIEVMKLFSAMPENDNQVRAFQPLKMLGHGLACHGQMLAQFAEGLPIAVVQPIEQLSPARIGEGFKDFIHCPQIMQPNGCMSREGHFTLRSQCHVKWKSCSEQSRMALSED
jgi:hypothetical protein